MSASSIVLEEMMIPIGQSRWQVFGTADQFLNEKQVGQIPNFEVRFEAATLLSQAGDQPPALVWTGETRATSVGSRSRSSAG